MEKPQKPMERCYVCFTLEFDYTKEYINKKNTKAIICYNCYAKKNIFAPGEIFQGMTVFEYLRSRVELEFTMAEEGYDKMDQTLFMDHRATLRSLVGHVLNVTDAEDIAERLKYAVKKGIFQQKFNSPETKSYMGGRGNWNLVANR
jgi:hypothetical protein